MSTPSVYKQSYIVRFDHLIILNNRYAVIWCGEIPITISRNLEDIKTCDLGMRVLHPSLDSTNMTRFQDFSFIKYFVPGSIVNECYDDRDDVTENDELMTGGDC